MYRHIVYITLIHMSSWKYCVLNPIFSFVINKAINTKYLIGAIIFRHDLKGQYHEKLVFFSYAGHGRTVAYIFSIDIQQFSIITTLTIIQYLPYDYNIVLGGHLRHYINICFTILIHICWKTTFIRRRISKTNNFFTIVI